MTKINLNQKQKKFVDEYIKTGNATQSAIKAGYSEKTAYSIGQRLLKNVEIVKALETKQEKLQEKFEYSIEKSFRNFEKAQEIALAKKRLLLGRSDDENSKSLEIEDPDITNFIKAEELKGRLFGFYTERKEVTETTETFEERLKKFRDKKD